MAVTHGKHIMSKNDDQGRLPPPENTTPALREGERMPDPIEALTSGLGDDPALGDLIAFRQSRPDLKEAARMSRQFNNEAHRVAYAVDRNPPFSSFSHFHSGCAPAPLTSTLANIGKPTS